MSAEQERNTFADPDLVKRLALRAIDAARSVGAAYADVRLTRTVTEGISDTFPPTDGEALAVGVRCLVNGYWGFAASQFWKDDEMVTLAREAVTQARANALGSSRRVELGTYPVVQGHWTTPLRIDPFAVTLEEKFEFVRALSAAITDHSKEARPVGTQLMLVRQERALATSEGTYCTQTIFQSGCNFGILLARIFPDGQHEVGTDVSLPVGTGGWEYILDAKMFERIPPAVAQCEEWIVTPNKRATVGRHDVIFDAFSTAGILDATIGVGTELDRALGYEANAGGTSYLGPNALAMAGTQVASAPVLTVTADRSMPNGAATVQWDDEGVAPRTMTLVTNGVLTDYQTTRESSAWLAPYYAAHKIPVQSGGYAASPSALSITMQHAPNFTMAPARDEITFEDLIAGTSRGLVAYHGYTQTDFQAKNGVVRPGVLREIVNGRLGAIISNGTLVFQSLEFWNNLTAMGGSKSVAYSAIERQKGQPKQYTTHGIRSVPAAFKNVALVDIMRKA